MTMTINGKKKNIPDATVKKYMKAFDMTQEEAVHMYLEEEGVEVNEELEALDAKAKKVKIDHGASSTEVIEKKMNTFVPDKTKQKTQKERVKKPNDDKAAIIAVLAEALGTMNLESIDIENPEKLIKFEMNGKKFSLNLVQNRK